MDEMSSPYFPASALSDLPSQVPRLFSLPTRMRTEVPYGTMRTRVSIGIDRMHISQHGRLLPFDLALLDNLHSISNDIQDTLPFSVLPPGA